ncbi:MAG: hypothetical protein WBM50_03110 [Acidimicrobiales bacterium]
MIPIDIVGIEPDAEPPLRPRVTRQEEALRIGGDHGFVDARWCFAGDRDAVVTVVAIQVPREPFVADRSTEVLVAFASVTD